MIGKHTSYEAVIWNHLFVIIQTASLILTEMRLVLTSPPTLLNITFLVCKEIEEKSNYKQGHLSNKVHKSTNLGLSRLSPGTL